MLKIVTLEFDELQLVLVKQLAVHTRIIRIIDTLARRARVVLEPLELVCTVVANGWFGWVGEAFDVVLSVQVCESGRYVYDVGDEQHYACGYNDDLDGRAKRHYW